MHDIGLWIVVWNHHFEGAHCGQTLQESWSSDHITAAREADKRPTGKHYDTKLLAELPQVHALVALRTRTSWHHLGSEEQRAIYTSFS